MFRYASMLITLLIHPSLSMAAPIGELEMTDGRHYIISQLGTPERPKDYYVSIDKQFVSMDKVSQIARIGVDKGKMAFLVSLNNGELNSGRHGFFFYDQVEYNEPTSGLIKTGYVPVFKGRDNDGFVFVAYDPENHTESIVEIPNPNNISLLEIWEDKKQEQLIKVADREIGKL